MGNGTERKRNGIKRKTIWCGKKREGKFPAESQSIFHELMLVKPLNVE